MLGWFQALMPKEGRFFDLFTRHATIVVAGAEALRGLLQGGDGIEGYCKQIFEREAEAAGDRSAFHSADEAFHAAVATVGRYPGIWSLVQGVKTQIDRYRLLTLPQPGRMARVIKEHAAVVAAIEDHDPDRAAAAMEAHLDGLQINADDIRRMNADFFYEDIHGKEDFLA